MPPTAADSSADKVCYLNYFSLLTVVEHFKPLWNPHPVQLHLSYCVLHSHICCLTAAFRHSCLYTWEGGKIWEKSYTTKYELLHMEIILFWLYLITIHSVQTLNVFFLLSYKTNKTRKKCLKIKLTCINCVIVWARRCCLYFPMNNCKPQNWLLNRSNFGC